MSDALLRKCPTCQSPKGLACLKLAVVPGNRVLWVASETHPARERPRG